MVIAGKSLSESHLPDMEYHFPEKLETEMRDELLSFKLKKKKDSLVFKASLSAKFFLSVIISFHSYVKRTNYHHKNLDSL